ncbi:hypothetical protein Tcan_09705 [Toxocara canis]|uniref:Uncharacterized protein n=1 Tax=Toxocara canis TaxID=6265 RepID=A0A0B2VG73_TOXCA|nr:hypothetical protein Tcan_09705 [Toxocara canis]
MMPLSSNGNVIEIRRSDTPLYISENCGTSVRWPGGDDAVVLLSYVSHLEVRSAYIEAVTIRTISAENWLWGSGLQQSYKYVGLGWNSTETRIKNDGEWHKIFFKNNIMLDGDAGKLCALSSVTPVYLTVDAFTQVHCEYGGTRTSSIELQHTAFVCCSKNELCHRHPQRVIE